jgi:predicted ArsR family transcriptional regulator
MPARARSQSRPKTSDRGRADEDDPKWTFLSNHSHVLICLHQDPELTLREVANRVGITERSVQRILGELEDAGYLRRERRGLRNHYRFKTTAPLRHPIEEHCKIGDLIRMVEAAGS